MTDPAGRLRVLAARRDRQADALAETRAELGAAVLAALASGVGPSEVARLSGLSRMHVHRIQKGAK